MRGTFISWLVLPRLDAVRGSIVRNEECPHDVQPKSSVSISFERQICPSSNESRCLQI